MEIFYHVGYTTVPCLLHIHRLLLFLLNQELDLDARHSMHLRKRAARRTSEPTATILFFFGCRNPDNDFLHEDFWYAHAHEQGVLSSERACAAQDRGAECKSVELVRQWGLSIHHAGSAS